MAVWISRLGFGSPRLASREWRSVKSVNELVGVEHSTDTGFRCYGHGVMLASMFPPA